MQDIESIFNQNVISLHDDDILVISINRNLGVQEECEGKRVELEDPQIAAQKCFPHPTFPQGRPLQGNQIEK